MSRFLAPGALLSLFCAFTAISIPPADAQDEIVITTLEWPPYTGSGLPDLGVTTHVVSRAFSEAGIDASVEVVPWKRAIAMAKNEAGVAAYFPGYHCHHDTGFVASSPVGNGPLGLAEHVNAPVEWESVDDLKAQGLRIGTVLGYANTEEFDSSVADGSMRTVPAKDDATNLRKLAMRRLDAAVIDKLVMSYLLATDPSLKDSVASLTFDERPLEEKILYVCFTDDASGHALRDRFNAGLEKLDVDSIVDEYFVKAF